MACSVFILFRNEDLLRVLGIGVFCLSKYASTAALESCAFPLFDTCCRVYSEWAGGECDFLSGGGSGFFEVLAVSC